MHLTTMHRSVKNEIIAKGEIEKPTVKLEFRNGKNQSARQAMPPRRRRVEACVKNDEFLSKDPAEKTHAYAKYA